MRTGRQVIHDAGAINARGWSPLSLRLMANRFFSRRRKHLRLRNRIAANRRNLKARVAASR